MNSQTIEQSVQSLAEGIGDSTGGIGPFVQSHIVAAYILAGIAALIWFWIWQNKTRKLTFGRNIALVFTAAGAISLLASILTHWAFAVLLSWEGGLFYLGLLFSVQNHIISERGKS